MAGDTLWMSLGKFVIMFINSRPTGVQTHDIIKPKPGVGGYKNSTNAGLCAQRRAYQFIAVARHHGTRSHGRFLSLRRKD